jgi:glycosyltransferase involved in cell wall biosynthesis
MAAAMAQLMADPAQRRRLGENARASARRFDLSTVTQSWERLIDACLGSGEDLQTSPAGL